MPRLTKALAIVLTLVTVGGFMVGRQVVPRSAAVEPSDAASGFATHPLDAFPGFGRSPSAALRDDTFAYWEAYRREKFIQRCMARAGFRYTMDVEFPADAVVAVANGLAIRPEGNNPDPAVENDAYVASLEASALDRYYRTLVGESSGNIEAFEQSGGAVPPAVDAAAFATGGCTGEAAEAIGSVWDVPRAFATQAEKIRGDAARIAAGEYAGCVATFDAVLNVTGSSIEGGANPAHLEGAIAAVPPSDGHRTALTVTLQTCGPVWDAGYRSAEAGLVRKYLRCDETDTESTVRCSNAVAMLGATRTRYATAEVEIAADLGFKQYLAGAAGRATAAVAAHIPHD